MADREEELRFRDENGSTDWRGRVDAARDSLEQAKSHQFWGQEDAALEKALDAARLLPPASKVFDLPNTQLVSTNKQSASVGDLGTNAGQENVPEEGEPIDAQEPSQKGRERSGSADETFTPPASDSGRAEYPENENGSEQREGKKDTRTKVTDEEVDALRKELNEFLSSIEQDVGTLRYELRLDREAIEIE